MTQAERAEALGITDRHLRRLEKEGCPKDLEGARTWVAARSTASDKPGDLNEETTRLRAAQADLAELDAAERRRELAPVADFQVAFSEVMVIIATQLDGAAGRVAAQVAAMTDAGEVRQLLLDEFRQIRRAAAARIADWAGGVFGPDPAGAAADEDAGPVGGSGEKPTAG